MPDQTITSRQNPIVARFKTAADHDDRWMLLDGIHLLGEALDAGLSIDCVAVDQDRVEHEGVAHVIARVPPSRVISVSRQVLAALSPVRTPTGVVALAARPSHTAADLYAHPTALLLAAIDIQDPGNLGAIVRAAEAGGATGVVTTPGGADPYGWKALRGAMGSAFRLPILGATSAVSALDAAKNAGLRIVAADGHGGTAMHDVDFAAPTLIVLGTEGQGLPDEVAGAADVRASIPMTPPVESLNVAVAAALLVYEARRQRGAMRTTAKGTKAGTKGTKP